MDRRLLASTSFLLALACSGPANESLRSAPDAVWQSTFEVAPSDLVSTGANPWFVLVPGYECKYADRDGEQELVVRVLDETETVDGVATRVVEERETDKGRVVEVSRNYFALSRTTGDVYYFGEDVDIYRDGKVTDHSGAWRSGVDGARFGLMVPGRAVVGQKGYQEFAPLRALDRFTITSASARVETPAGTFTDCLEVEETTPLEPGVREFKRYAPGVGLVQDDELLLVSHTPVPVGR